MENKWFNLLEDCGIYAASWQEAKLIEEGLKLYLKNYGMQEDSATEYQLGFVKRRVEELPIASRKEFFMAYPLLWEYEEICRMEEHGGTADREKKYQIAAWLMRYPSLQYFWEPMF